MVHKLLKQRRRFAFALLLMQLALYGVWEQTGIFALMTLGLVCAAILIAAFGDTVRRLIECSAIGLLAASRMPTANSVTVVFMLATAAAYILLYTPVLDRIPLRIGMRSRKTFVAPYDTRTTWAKTLPGQGHMAAYWTGTMISAKQDEHDDATLYLTFRDEHGAVEEVTVTYLSVTPTTQATYLLERDTLLAGEEIIIDYTFESAGAEQTRIYSDMRVSGLPVRHAVERFFDDVLGDELDSFATMSECKRSWSLRDLADIQLTSGLGRGDVILAIAPEKKTETAEADVRLSA